MNCIAILLFWYTAYDAANPPYPTPEIAQLIGQLDDESWQLREEASDVLRHEGFKALRALEQARKSKSAEVRRRAELLIQDFNQVDLGGIDIPYINGLVGLETTIDKRVVSFPPGLARWYYIKANKNGQEATRLFMRDLLRAGLSKPQIHHIMCDMFAQQHLNKLRNWEEPPD